MSHEDFSLSPSTQEFKFSLVAFILPLPFACSAEKLVLVAY